MAQKRLAVVLGSTSGQGRSVVNALLKTSYYSVRGVTRDPHSEEAQELTRRGVEVVEGDLDNPHSLTAAFTAANVIFAVTKMVGGAMDREVTQGKNVANAAAAVGVLEHFIWSTLPSASTVSRGSIAVPHMDGKAQVDEYIINSQPALAQKTTFLWGGFYAENVQYPNFTYNLLASAGKYIWVQPVHERTLVPMVGDHNVNIGTVVERILTKPEICLSMAYVLAVTEWMENGELLRLWAKIVGEKQGQTMDTVYVQSGLEAVDQLWPVLGKEMGLMLKVLEELGKEAWSKKGVKVITMQDLGLKVGDEEGDLVSTEKAIRNLV
jgi:NAD(P)-dependent dehydrogenase (short-subunit alcohol dehydrogenase family)